MRKISSIAVGPMSLVILLMAWIAAESRAVGPQPAVALVVQDEPTLLPQTEAIDAGDWVPIAPGISRRYVPILLDGGTAPTDMYALKLDPEQVRFQVNYEQGVARDIDSWRIEMQADVVVNGGFFTGDYRAVGRLIEDGVLYGFPLDYGERSVGVPGMFTVLDDGLVNLYSMGRDQYRPRDLDIWQAIESYPMLVLPGGQPQFHRETSKFARRTAIGIDSDGDVLVMVVDQPVFTLYAFSRWLAASDLNIDMALNLDGGRSSGLAAVTGAESIIIPSYVDVVSVLAIYTR